MTISTTYFRENLAQVIHKVVDSGEPIILVFGKGKNAKKVTLSPLIDKKTKAKKTKLRQLLESKNFLNRPIKPAFKQSQNIQELMQNQYNINDFLA